MSYVGATSSRPHFEAITKKMRRITMNLKRVLTGMIGLPIVAVILIFGNKYIIDVLFAIVAEISIYEYFNATSKQYKPVKYLGHVIAILIAFIHIIPIEILTKIISCCHNYLR